MSGGDQYFTTLPDPPVVTTDSATNVKGTQATLNGTVNPNGVTASYQAECRKGSTEGAAVLGPKGEVSKGTSSVSVSALASSLEPATAYQCRLIASNTGGSGQGEWATLETKAVGVPELSELPVTEPFDGSSTSYTHFQNLWSKLGWAEGKGEDTTGGWALGAGKNTSTQGAYYSQGASDAGWGLAAAGTLTGLVAENSFMSLWLDMPTPAGTKAGYELRFTNTASDTYNVSLSKWVGGNKTELASKTGYSFTAGNSFALADLGGRVTAFTDTGSGYSQLLSVADSTYEGGNGGLEGYGAFIGLSNFEFGPLTPKGKSPGVKTEAATSIKATKATLNGTVNPEGLATSYYFEYGKTTSYGTKVPVGAASAGSGTSPVAVSEPIANLEPGTTYHFRLVAESEGKSKGEDISLKTAAGISGSQLASLPVTEPFDGSSTSLANFESNFGTLHGSGGTTPKGKDYSNGWGPWDSSPTVNGTYYSPTFSDVGWGLAAEAKLNATPTEAEGRYFSLWIDMPTPASALIGYELRFTTISAGVFKVALYEWGGSSHELASLGSYSMANGSSVALLDQGSKISAWTNTGSGFGEVLSATDSTFSGGSAALRGVSSATRMADFRVGALRAPLATTEAASEVGIYSAKLNGTVNPEGLATNYYFEYGETTSYGTKIPYSAEEAGSSSSNVSVHKSPGGLTPGATYHYRLVAENEAGQRKGEDKTFTALKEPKATTEAATEVKTTSATLNGTVNPEGDATSYYFEYGIGSASENKIPANAKEVGSGTSNVAVHETPTGLSAGKTYRYRVVAVKAGFPVGGGEKEFTTTTTTSTGEEINVLPTLDALSRSETPLSGGGKWSALAWDTSTSGHNTGYDTTTGWGAYDASPTINGANWSTSAFNDKTGDAAAATMQAAPTSEGRYLALWLDMSSPGSSKSGYQLRWTYNTGGTYTVKLSKWSAGKETELASNASVSIPLGTTLAISDTGGIVTAWKGTGGSLTAILSAGDSALSEGYAGIEASGTKSRLTNFKAGRLLGGAITGAPVLDDFARKESSLETGKWTKTSWTQWIGCSWAGEWHGYGASSASEFHLAGAYWNPTTFSDASGPIVVAATLGTGPTGAGEYLSLWLDMPNPGSAKSGYEARLTGNGSASTFKVELSKWVSGTRTVLASKEGFSLPLGTTMALTETGGALTLWTGTSSFSPVLSATDSTYSSGYAGLEANEGEGTEYDFRAGGL